MASAVAIIACALLLREYHGVFAFSSLSTRNVLVAQQQQPRRTRSQPILYGSFFDDLFGGGSESKDTDKDGASPKEAISNKDEDDDDGLWDASGLQAEIDKRNAESSSSAPSVQAVSAAAVEKDGDKEEAEEVEFDGYMFRDAIYNKFGVCWDVDFQRVESYGFKKFLYLNVLPFRLGSKRFRHETEYDYLCHLQAVVEILQKYDLLYSVLAQLEETNKKPRPGTSPLVAVPLRLDLSPEQLDEILGPAT